MKPHFSTVLFLLLFGSAFATSNQSVTRPASGDTLDLIIGITATDATVISDIRAKIASVNNSQLICFCTNMNVFIVRSSKLSYASEEEFFNACQKMAGSEKLYLKNGAVNEIARTCAISNEDDPAKVKEISR